MTRIDLVKAGKLTDEVVTVAKVEGVELEALLRDVAQGVSVIVRNKNHDIKPLVIGRGLKTKVNANIVTSRDRIAINDEVQKLNVLIKYGADTVMDLSTGGPIKEIRKLILQKSTIPAGTVPIYEAGN